MEITQRVFIAAFIYLGVIPLTSAVLCSFHTSHGILQHKYCKERCCQGPDVRYSNVCCYYKRGSEIYIGTGIAVLVVLAVLILCFTYICCRQKLLRLSRDAEIRHRNTRLTARSSRRTNPLPTVSEQVQLPTPPPYEILPPPYYSVESDDKEKNGNASSLPDGPPPAYSTYDPCCT